MLNLTGIPTFTGTAHCLMVISLANLTSGHYKGSALFELFLWFSFIIN
uniref:Uncharacterized protein n=1 Tax=Anguilla anguilla TaxID=7936 RepID=A0A0E9PIK1_ANGAN